MPDVYGDKAHFRGEDRPRCKATPGKVEKPSPGRWGCALPEGHEDYDNERHRSHVWVRL